MQAVLDVTEAIGVILREMHRMGGVDTCGIKHGWYGKRNDSGPDSADCWSMRQAGVQRVHLATNINL